MRRPAFALLLLATALATPAPGPAAAADPGRELEKVQEKLKEKRQAAEQQEKKLTALRRELEKLREKSVKVAARVQARESTLNTLEQQLDTLETAEKDMRDELLRRHEQMGGVLAALQRMAWNPKATILARRDNVTTSVRTAILLKSILPAIDARARRVRHDLHDLAEVRAQIRDQKAELRKALKAVRTERRRLSVLLQRKGQLRAEVKARLASTRQEVSGLARKAEDLKQLMERLAEEKTRARRAARGKPSRKPPAERGRAFEAARGEMPLPVRGSITTRYGSKGPEGHTSHGLRIRARPGATVVSPHGGKVVFADSFRQYGLLLIIDHGDGYHSLLAGLAKIHAETGQWVLAGEPVGVMASGGTDPTLYVELRRNDQPVNPMPWLAAKKGKVSG